MRCLVRICVIISVFSAMAFAQQTPSATVGRDLNTGQTYTIKPGNG